MRSWATSSGSRSIVPAPVAVASSEIEIGAATSGGTPCAGNCFGSDPAARLVVPAQCLLRSREVATLVRVDDRRVLLGHVTEPGAALTGQHALHQDVDVQAAERRRED